MKLSAKTVFAISLLSATSDWSSNLALAQELCRSAIEIPASDFGTPISGSTINGTATTEGCRQTEPKVKQWYRYELNATMQGYYTFLSCAASNNNITTAIDNIDNKVQLGSCDASACYNPIFHSVVDPADLAAISECSDTDNVATFTYLHGGIGNVTNYGFVTLGDDMGDNTGDFTTGLIQHRPPSNDFCEDAIPMERNGPPVAGSLYNARPLTGSICGTNERVGVWFSFPGHQFYKAVIRTCPVEPMDGFGHSINVEDDCGGPCSCVTCQVVDNPDCAGGKQLTVTTVAGRTYYVAVSSSLRQSRGTFTVQYLTENTITDSPTSSPTPVSAPTSPTTPSPVETPTDSTSMPTEETSSANSAPASNWFAFLVLVGASTLLI